MTWLLIFLLWSSPSRAEGEEFQIEVNPRVYSKKAFQGKNVTVGDIPPRVKRPDALPEKSEREKVFAGLPEITEELRAMDELDRDILFVRAKNRTLQDLEKLYPKISASKLKKLQRALEARTK